MPKKIINYQKSVIYKIEHIEKPEILYIGSTTDFIKRKYQHKDSCNNQKRKNHNINLYLMIRENGGWDSFKIMIIKEYPCNSKIELLIEEDKQIKELKASMNKNKAHSTEEDKKNQKKDHNEKNIKINKKISNEEQIILLNQQIENNINKIKQKCIRIMNSNK
jgi:predicted GIY-YIG superfamily endonuclease